MDPENTALPTDGNVAAGEPAQTAPATEPHGEQTSEHAEGHDAGTESAEGGEKPEGKKEKTPEQREIDRLRRRVDNLTRKKYELQAQREQQPAQRQVTQEGEDEPVTLSRAELDRMIAERAEKLAPVVKEKQAEFERRQGLMTTLSKEWGQEKFAAIAEELDEVLGGLGDAGGRPKPVTEAILEADDPKSVIEYLTDPDNADEAERIAHSSAVRAGREIARIEEKLKDEKAKAKPKPSNAARPLESVKGGGVPAGMPDPSDTKRYIKWANEQEFAARR